MIAPIQVTALFRTTGTSLDSGSPSVAKKVIMPRSPLTTPSLIRTGHQPVAIDPTTGLIPQGSLPALSPPAAEPWRHFCQQVERLPASEQVQWLTDMGTAEFTARERLGVLAFSLRHRAVRYVAEAIERALDRADAPFGEYVAALTPAAIMLLGRHSVGLFRLMRSLPLAQQATHPLCHAWFDMVIRTLTPLAPSRHAAAQAVCSDAVHDLDVLWEHHRVYGPLSSLRPVATASPTPSGVKVMDPLVSHACAAIATWLAIHPVEDAFVTYAFARLAATPPLVQAHVQRSLQPTMAARYAEWLAGESVAPRTLYQQRPWMPVAEADVLLGKSCRYVTTHKCQLPRTWFRTIKGRSYVDRRAVLALRQWLASPVHYLRSSSAFRAMTPTCQAQAREQMLEVWDVPAHEEAGD